MLIGYIRVSTRDQNPARQRKKLADYEQEAGVRIERIFEDKATGSSFDRESYRAMKLTLRAGDTLIVTELDRLGRSMNDIKKEWQEIQQMGVDIIVIDTPVLNTSEKTDLEKSLISNIVFELLAYLGEKERMKIRERQREGIEVAKAKGVYKGRKPIPYDKDRFTAVCREWRAGKMTARSAMQKMGMKPNKFYREVKAMGL